MTDTFRALCAELTYCWSRTTNPDDFAENAAPIIGRMRAALAQPEKECDQPDDPRWQEYEQDIANHAAEWGYDQRDKVDEAKLQKARDEELEACCEWLCHEYRYGVDLALKLRAARRPKPTSLKEQALELARPAGTEGAYVTFGPEELALIRRALEALPDD